LKVLELRAYEMVVNDIQVETQLANNLPLTMGDVNQLQQVFLNIIMNAEKAMVAAHVHGRLNVRTELVENKIVVSFIDNGPGIDKEHLVHIFDPFFTTREVGSGTGLGLSICHGIVNQHDGKIYAESEPGNGATFVVELPVMQMSPPVVADDVAINGTLSKRDKVLVVDDETAILDFLQRVLEEWGYEVTTENGTKMVMDRLGREEYDLILLDVKMPAMSGIDLYQHIMGLDSGLAPKVIFITGDVMETATRNFLEETGAPHIAKPFYIEKLLATINQVLAAV